MNENQKDFLNDLAAVFRKYNVNCVRADSDNIVFESNSQDLKIGGYSRRCSTYPDINEEFTFVVSTCIAAHYVPQSFFDSSDDIIDCTTKEAE